MWRDLTTREVREITQKRQPVTTIGTALLVFLMLLPLAFFVAHLPDLLLDFSWGEVIGIGVDVALFLILVFLVIKLNRVMKEDLKNGDLMACEVLIEGMKQVQYYAKRSVPRYEANTVLAWEVTVKQLDEMGETLRVRASNSFDKEFQAGDRAILITGRKQPFEKNIFLPIE